MMGILVVFVALWLIQVITSFVMNAESGSMVYNGENV